MDVASFAEIADELSARVRRIIWCTVATVDRRGRPRSRILHPIWEGPVCWVATQRNSFKGKHIANNPYVSLTYFDREQQQQIYADCRAEWEDDPAEKRRVWQLYLDTPPPLGYDLTPFFGGIDSPRYGLLKLTPWRIELWSLPEMIQRIPNKVWRNPEAL